MGASRILGKRSLRASEFFGRCLLVGLQSHERIIGADTMRERSDMHHPLEDVQDFSDSCIRCGLCAQTDCGNFSNGEPNLGELCESILNGEETWDYAPFTCALCNRCTINCPVDLVASRANKPLRALLLEKKPELRPLYRKFRTDLKYNVFSALRARDTGDITNVTYIQGEANLGGAADRTAFFPGCALYAYAPELTAKVSQWLRDEGLPPTRCLSAAVRPFTMSASMPNTTPIASACRLSYARGILSALS